MNGVRKFLHNHLFFVHGEAYLEAKADLEFMVLNGYLAGIICGVVLSGIIWVIAGVP